MARKVPQPEFWFRFRQNLRLRFRPIFRFKCEPKSAEYFLNLGRNYFDFLSSIQFKYWKFKVFNPIKLNIHHLLFNTSKKYLKSLQYNIQQAAISLSISVPVSVPVPVSVHVSFRFSFWFKLMHSSFGSVPVPADISVPVDH